MKTPFNFIFYLTICSTAIILCGCDFVLLKIERETTTHVTRVKAFEMEDE